MSLPAMHTLGLQTLSSTLGYTVEQPNQAHDSGQQQRSKRAPAVSKTADRFYRCSPRTFETG